MTNPITLTCYWGTTCHEFHHHWMPLNNQLHTGAWHKTACTVLWMLVPSCVQSPSIVPVRSTLQISWKKLWSESLEGSLCSPRHPSTRAVCWLTAECLSVRQLILQHRLRSRLAFVYNYIVNIIYIYVAIDSHAQECNYRLRLKHILVPVCFRNLTPLLFSSCTGPQYAVWMSAGTTQWSCPHSIGLRCELGEIYCYYETRTVPVQ